MDKETGREFKKFCIDNEITYTPDSENYFNFSESEWNKIERLTKIFDGSKGGIVIGKTHAEGGIHLFIKLSDGSYRYWGEMEGKEFISPPNLSEKQFEMLVAINDKIGTSEISVLEDFEVIDLTKESLQILLLSDSNQFIIKKESTLTNLKEILEVIQNEK